MGGEREIISNVQEEVANNSQCYLCKKKKSDT